MSRVFPNAGLGQWKPVVIVGAPRSGTNMLRDVLCSLPGAATWPCDEINYIWRHGNVAFPSDELQPCHARPAVRRYIRKQFRWVARRYQCDIVVEKTCANSLRVPFVNCVVPEAKFLFIRRDGLDVVGSAAERWQSDMDFGYLARKSRFVPPSDLPYYALRYMWSRAYRFYSDENRVSVWGPRTRNMVELLEKHGLQEICALQWQQCVVESWQALNDLPSDRWMEIGYENFVANPQILTEEICDFLELPAAPDDLSIATSRVRSASVGKGRSDLTKEELDRMVELVGPTLERFGYI